MKVSDLKAPKGARKKRKVVGRGSGSGHGKTSCRGHKGQLSRTGKGRRPGFEGGQMPLIRRVPKRGFTSKFKEEYQVVNLQDLDKCKDKSTVTPLELAELRIIRRKNIPVKVLGQGKLTKNLTVKAHKFSKRAQEQIEALGGKIKIIIGVEKAD
ncbi:MAG: 50S ribosomal protein L15 [PVC group bacterium]|nr:50S ribosomal protein L15 [PVC group bacterium]